MFYSNFDITDRVYQLFLEVNQLPVKDSKKT
jgi:hypothetical protein